MHRDLKPLNLLLTSDCRLLLCDFGLIRSMGGTQGQTELAQGTDQVGSRWYRAPEIMMGSRRYGPAADMWSAGCVLAELMTAKVRRARRCSASCSTDRCSSGGPSGYGSGYGSGYVNCYSGSSTRYTPGAAARLVEFQPARAHLRADGDADAGRPRRLQVGRS